MEDDFGENLNPEQERYERHLAEEAYWDSRMPKSQKKQPAKAVNSKRRQTDPTHYQRFLSDALPLANTRFEDRTSRKDELLRIHFPRQYESQRMAEYDALKLGATFAHLVRASQDIARRARR
jgi:hypothetical protein